MTETIKEIPLDELHPFPDHPFGVRDDEAMEQTVESIREYGILVPAIARPREEGGYELIAGHRRKHACEIAGIKTMPVIVRDIDRNAAVIIMVDSNLQRENILPSEKAKAYKMKLEAIKRQGARHDLTSTQVAQKLSVEKVAEEAGTSKDQVRRFIRLNELEPQLIEKQYSVKSINSMLVSVNSLLAFLGWSDCRVKSIRQQRQIYCTEEKELTKSEYLRLLEAAKKKPQLRLVMETICGTGIRVSELRYFTVEAVRRGEIVVNCKAKTRTILLPGKLRKLLLDYAKKNQIVSGSIFVTRNGNPLNRSNIWSDMKKLCETANVKASKVFPHNLRKLFARTFYGIEKDIAKLADILGHSSIDTTRIYIISTGTEHRREIERLGLVI